MKKFIFISYGFETPTPEVMEAWGKWFALVGDRMVEQGHLGSGKEFAKDGSKDLNYENGAATGYIIFNAESTEEAEEIAAACPVIASNVIQEIMPKEESCD